MYTVTQSEKRFAIAGNIKQGKGLMIQECKAVFVSDQL